MNHTEISLFTISKKICYNQGNSTLLFHHLVLYFFQILAMLPILLTLFDIGDHDVNPNVFEHCAQTRKRKNLKLSTFNINLWSIKKVFF